MSSIRRPGFVFLAAVLSVVVFALLPAEAQAAGRRAGKTSKIKRSPKPNVKWRRAGFLRLQTLGHLRGATSPEALALGFDFGAGVNFSKQVAAMIGGGLSYPQTDVPWDKTGNFYLDFEFFPQRWKQTDAYGLIGATAIFPVNSRTGVEGAAGVRIGGGLNYFLYSPADARSQKSMIAFGIRPVARFYRALDGGGGLGMDFQVQIYVDYWFRWTFKAPKLMNI